jgi:hypothetical protein
MRAPDDKINIPGFFGVPEYSPLERACRHAGEAPQGSVLRRSLQRRFGKLIRRRGDINSRDVRALIAYVKGEFDRKPEQGRPFDPWHHHATSAMDDIVRDVRHEHGCSYKEAITIAFERFDIDDPDGWKAKAVLKRLTR